MDTKVIDDIATPLGERGTVLPLNQVHDDWKVEVVAYLSSGRGSRRLAELGLTPGTPIRILRSKQSQPLLICVRGTHLAVDLKTAASLSVRVLHGERRKGRGLRGRGRRRHHCVRSSE